MYSLRGNLHKSANTLTNSLVKFQSKNLHKTFRPSYYNLRHYYSNLRRNDHGYGKWEMIYGPEGFEKVFCINSIGFLDSNR